MARNSEMDGTEVADLAREMREAMRDEADFGTVWRMLTDHLVACMDANLVEECVVFDFVEDLNKFHGPELEVVK